MCSSDLGALEGDAPVPEFGSARCGAVEVGLGRVRVMRWCPSSV